MLVSLKTTGDISIVELQGPLEIDLTQPFREACKNHFKEKKVIFNLERVNFVGSTGIQSFLETIRLLAENRGIKLVGTKSELKRMIENLALTNLEFCETEDQAFRSFLTPLLIPEADLSSD